MSSIIEYFSIIVNTIIFKINRLEFSKIQGKGICYVRNKGILLIGKNFRFNSGKFFNPIGGDTMLRLIVLKNGKLRIGDNVGVSNCSIFCSSQIIIEDNVLIGGGVRIWDTDFHSLNYKLRGTKEDFGLSKPINVRKNAFIGAGSIILKGVEIGENSIVGAGSVVAKSIPANEIWAGNPCKKIRNL